MAQVLSGMRDVGDLLHVGETLAYETHLRKVRFVRFWLTYLGRGPNKRHRFEFWQVLDKAALEEKGQIHVSGTLETTAGFRPLAYAVQAGDQCFTLRLGPRHARATTADGSRLTAESDAPEALLPSNALSVLSLSLALRRDIRDAEGAVDIPCFMPESMLPMAYSVRRKGKSWRSNLDETLHFDPDGFIDRLDIPDKGVSAWRIRKAPPRWAKPGAAAVRTKAAKDPGPALGADDHAISFQGPRGKVAGALRFPPAGKALQGAVLFLGGSGLFDRDGRTVAGFDLGYGTFCARLAKFGFATLRYDKPGAGETKRGSKMEARYDDVVETAKRAYGALRREPDLVGVPTAVIGHSQGGLVALELAGRVAVDALGLLATSAQRIDQILRDQLKYQMKRLKVPRNQAAAQMAEIERFFTHVRRRAEWTPETVPAPIYSSVRSRYWYRELLARDPLRLIRKVDAPVLIAQGGRDIQVRPGDARVLVRAARNAGLDVEVLSFPDHDHLFRVVRSDDAMKGYFDRRRKLDRKVADTIIRRLRNCLPPTR